MNPLKEFVQTIEIPDEINEHISAATSDLYFGPKDPDFWREEKDDPSLPDYSFIDSCRIISEWVDELDIPSFIDEDGCPVNDAESVDYCNKYEIPYYEVCDRSFKSELLGSELAQYIR